MKLSDIYNEHLLLGKVITLSFPDARTLTNFRSNLGTVKKRAEATSGKFGFTTGTEDLSICTECQGDPGNFPATYKVWLGKKKPKPPAFTILEISPENNSDNDQ